MLPATRSSSDRKQQTAEGRTSRAARATGGRHARRRQHEQAGPALSAYAVVRVRSTRPPRPQGRSIIKKASPGRSGPTPLAAVAAAPRTGDRVGQAHLASSTCRAKQPVRTPHHLRSTAPAELGLAAVLTDVGARSACLGSPRPTADPALRGRTTASVCEPVNDGIGNINQSSSLERTRGRRARSARAAGCGVR